MVATRSYRGVSADDRREQRRTTLVDTALDCLLDDGLSGVSVRSVCARSKLTPRYFYEQFTDLDELLVAAIDSVVDEVAEASMAAVRAAALDPPAQVRAAIEMGLGIVTADPRKANALLVAAVGHGPLRERRHKIVTAYADLFMDVFGLVSSLELVERRTARATALFLMGGSADVIEAVLAGRLAMSHAELVDHLTVMWLGVLSARSGTVRPSQD